MYFPVMKVNLTIILKPHLLLRYYRHILVKFIEIHWGLFFRIFILEACFLSFTSFILLSRSLIYLLKQ
jgi:hypothetical protein